MKSWIMVSLITFTLAAASVLGPYSGISRQSDTEIRANDIEIDYVVPIVSREVIERMDGFFTENIGQCSNQDVIFTAQGDPLSIALTQHEILFYLTDAESGLSSSFRLRLLNSNPVIPIGIGRMDHLTNFLLGNDASEWRRGAINFREVVYPNIYKNIDLRLYIDEGRFKYEFICFASSSIDCLELEYEGITGLEIEEISGDMLIKTDSGSIRDSRPFVYQSIDDEVIEVPSTFRIVKDTIWTTEICGEYISSIPLVIDPGLKFSTFLGGISTEYSVAVDCDEEGYVYVSGNTLSPDFPVTPGAYLNKTTPNNYSRYLAKFEPDLSDLVFLTFFGPPDGWGNDDDIATHQGVHVLSDGSILHVSGTFYDDYPITGNALMQTHSGSMDIIIQRFNEDGTDLFYGTYYGGSGSDDAITSLVDDDDDLYILGSTDSVDYPTSQGAFCSTSMGGQDIFLTKMAYPYTSVEFSTLVSGPGDEWGEHISLDSSGNIIIAADTTMDGFPTTPDAYNRSFSGGPGDGIIVKMDSTGSDILYSTYLGGSGWDWCMGAFESASGGFHISSISFSSDFPTTPDSISNESNGGVEFCYSEIDADGDLVYSTYLGGRSFDALYSNMYDPMSGRFYFSGLTYSYDFPTKPGCYDPYYRGYGDIFLLAFDVNDKDIDYGSFIGGTNVELVGTPNSMSLNSDGSVTLVGEVVSDDFPVTSRGFSTTKQTESDAFILTIDPEAVDVPKAPEGLSIEMDSTQLHLTWNESMNESYVNLGYSLYWGIKQGNISNVISIGDVTTHTHINLTNGQRYYYQIAAINSMGEGQRSDIESAVPMDFPSAPMDPMTSTGNWSVILTWDPPNDLRGGTLQGYTIFRGETSDNMEEIGSTQGPGESFTDWPDDLGKPYVYAVAARNERGLGEMSVGVPITPLGPPSVPLNLTLAPGNGEVHLSWSPPTSTGGSILIGFRVYFGYEMDDLSLLSFTLPTDLSYQHTGLINGVEVYYAVSAFNGVGEGNATTQLSAIPVGPPKTPQNPDATPGDGQVLLAWDPPEGTGGLPITGYKVLYGISQDDLNSVSENHEGSPAIITGLENGVVYLFSVIATNQIGDGEGSVIVHATPLGVPGVPTDFRVEYTKDGVLIAWKAPEDTGKAPIISHMVMRGTSPSEMVDILNVFQYTQAIDDSVMNGVTYYYSVYAFNIVSKGDASGQLSITIPTLPDAPKDLTAFIGPKQVLLTWSPPSNDGGSEILSFIVMRGHQEDLMSEIARLVGTEFTDSDILFGEVYLYKVMAMNMIGIGDATPVISVTPLPAPAAPGNLKVELRGDDVVLKWTAPAGDHGLITKYIVLRGPTGEDLSTIAEVDGQTKTYTDKGVPKGKSYYYSVRAESETGEGEPAPPIKLKVPSPSNPMLILVIVLVVIIVILVLALIRKGSVEREDVTPSSDADEHLKGTSTDEEEQPGADE